MKFRSLEGAISSHQNSYKCENENFVFFSVFSAAKRGDSHILNLVVGLLIFLMEIPSVARSIFMHFGIEIGGLFSRKRCSLRRCLPHEKWNVMYL